ncbi:cupin domain-containing protein [Gordonia sp. X0973]|nr:cupin domain-containing protein [Gordonia sp. X0973]
MYHLTSTSAPTYDLHGVTFSSYAASRSGASSLAAWRADFPPHTPGAAHSMTAEEVVAVLDGQLDVEVDDDRFTAAAGDAVLVPAGTRFRISNNSPASARAWVTTTLGMNAVMGDDQRIAPPWAQ